MKIQVPHDIGEVVYLMNLNKPTKALIMSISISKQDSNYLLIYKVLIEGKNNENNIHSDLLFSSVEELTDSLKTNYFIQ